MIKRSFAPSQTDVIRAIARLIEFYKHESCGQCTPCREGMIIYVNAYFSVFTYAICFITVNIY